MLYAAYQAHSDMMGAVRAFAGLAARSFGHTGVGTPGHGVVRNLTAAYELITRTGLTHTRPSYEIDTVRVGNRDVAVREEPLAATPFGTLLHFKKDIEVVQPRVLVVAPLSGHFATLLRSLVKTMLPDHDVCITDWHNARDVSTSDGRFGFEDYVEHLITWLEELGGRSHVVAVCQPCVAALAATALMSEDRHEATPASLTLMAGPIDCRISPTAVNRLATAKPIGWFERNLISLVPWRHAGAGRRVYPGFMQLSAFMSMNKERHADAFRAYYQNLVADECEKAEVTRAFYAEYMAVSDLSAD